MSSSHPTQPLSTRGELQPAGAHAPESPFSKAARLPPPSPDSPSLSHSRAPSHVGSVAQLPSSSNSSSSSDNEADVSSKSSPKVVLRWLPVMAIADMKPTLQLINPVALNAYMCLPCGVPSDQERSCPKLEAGKHAFTEFLPTWQCKKVSCGWMAHACI